jgi:type 1 glutamine amidotransferase
MEIEMGAMRYCSLVLLILVSQILLGCEKTVRVLIYSGSNNHNWQETTPELQRVLKQCSVFDATTTEHPEEVTAQQLASFDVIVSNWNNFGNRELDWPETARKAFVEFICAGGGHVAVHAGGSSFNDWQDYHKIAAYWGEKTGHGWYQGFTVEPTDTEHPITRGISDFQVQDELWHNTAFPPESTPLLAAFSSADKAGSGKVEPVLTVNRFGKGRCVNFMLGHDAKAMQNPGFETLLKRCVEWAATGSVKDASQANPVADKKTEGCLSAE